MSRSNSPIKDLSIFSLPTDDPQRPAIIIPSSTDHDAATISRADLKRIVLEFQLCLASMGVNQNSTVALVLPNGLSFVISFLAVVSQRAVAAPINPQYKEVEFIETLQLMKPLLVIIMETESDSETAAMAAAIKCGVPVLQCSLHGAEPKLCIGAKYKREGISPTQPDEIQQSDKALLLYTSGTTGTPKGVVLTHKNILVSMNIIIRSHELSADDRNMIITPLFHVAGVCGLLVTLFSGGCCIIPPSISGHFWQQLKDYEASWYLAVPTLHRLLLSFPRPERIPRLRFVRTVGSALPVETFHALEKQLNIPVLETYGMTETSSSILCNKIGGPHRPGFYPIPPEVEVRIFKTGSVTDNILAIAESKVGEIGEIYLRGESIMSGYLSNSAANKTSFVDSFFRTGDLGILHGDGYLQFTGRIKEIINKGGEKLRPEEIEQIVLTHDSIREVACFTVSDDDYGEDIGVAIVLEHGKTMKAIDVKKYVLRKAAAFKCPKKVVFLDAIPVKRGKYQRVHLSETYGGIVHR